MQVTKKLSFDEPQNEKLVSTPKILLRYTLVTDKKTFEILTPDISYIKKHKSENKELIFRGFEIFDEDMSSKSFFDDEEERPIDDTSKGSGN